MNASNYNFFKHEKHPPLATPFPYAENERVDAKWTVQDMITRIYYLVGIHKEIKNDAVTVGLFELDAGKDSEPTFSFNIPLVEKAPKEESKPFHYYYFNNILTSGTPVSYYQ